MAKIRRKNRLDRSASRLIAVTLGTLPAALALAASLAMVLPLPLTLGVRMGSYILMPVWAAAACATFLADNARDAWVSLLCLATMAALFSGSVLVLERGLVNVPVQHLRGD